MADKKTKPLALQTSIHTMVGNSGSPSDVLAPGDRVYLTDSDSHTYLREQVEAGNPAYEHLSLIEVDHEADARNEEEKQELLEQAAEIAAKQRAEAAQEEVDRQDELAASRARAEEEGQPAVGQDADFPPQDLEAQRLAAQSGAAQRATTDADVAEEDKQESSPSSRRRSGSSRNRS